MSTRKIFLSFGCSHTAGSEIDGRGDSDYNRQHSYGAKLAEKFGYDEHLNFAQCGGCNQRIFVLTTQVINEIIHKLKIDKAPKTCRRKIEKAARP